MDISPSQEVLLIVLEKVMERGLAVELPDGTTVYVRLAPQREDGPGDEPKIEQVRRTW